MKPTFSNNLEELISNFKLIEDDNSIKSSLTLIADSTKFSNEKLQEILKAQSKPTIGGIFPEIIYESERKTSGIIIIPLSFKLDTLIIDLEENEPICYSRFDSLNISHSVPPKSVFIFVDAMATNKNLFINYLFNYFGISLSYFGAGCGSLSFEKIPCVISNTGIYENAAVIGLTNEPIALGMSRSWEPISDQMKISEASNNRVKSINWEPAVNVYKKIIENHLGRKLSQHDLLDLLKSYPFGLVKIDGDLIIRDPYKIEGEDILFFDSVSDEEYVCVMHGNKESILSGAENARKNVYISRKKLNINDNNFMFCVNCISRVLYLQNEYKKEFDLFNDNQAIYGVLSIGEIVNSGKTILEIFNKIAALAICNQ